MADALFELPSEHIISGVIVLRFEPKHEMSTARLVEFFGYSSQTTVSDGVESWRYELGTGDGETWSAIVRVSEGEVKDTFFERVRSAG